VFLALFPLIARLASIATPGQHDWRVVVPFHLAASVVVSVIHVTVMVLIRKAIFLVAFAGPYIFTDNLARDFVYEYRKDLFGYALFLFLIMFGRQLAQQRRELAAAREDARKSQRLTLKCGGRSIFINAADIVWVKSASNYVEVRANGATHLARATLAAIERQLADAGVKATRVHRSWVVNTDHIRKIEPTGEGDVSIEMSDGSHVPGSRRYRDRLSEQI
jgi:DNA-binding LytR/AlgR family response regulator